MHLNKSTLSCIALFVLSLANAAGQLKQHYIGAIAEHAIYFGDGTQQLEDLLRSNLDMYKRHVSVAALNGAQLIVFPEFGLAPVVDNNRTQLGEIAEMIPDVSQDSLLIPCDNQDFSDRIILKESSCMAQQSSIIVMVNMIDWVDCSPSTDQNCPDDLHYQITTDVVFDETGRLVAKYHKSHEWPGLKPSYDQASEPSRVTYTSSFGVTFGLFICFDIMFEDPAVELVESGVRHFMYAVKQGLLGEETIISGFSKRHHVTMLSSNLAGSVVHDCSGVIVNGTTLPSKRIMLGEDMPGENVIISVVQK